MILTFIPLKYRTWLMLVVLVGCVLGFGYVYSEQELKQVQSEQTDLPVIKHVHALGHLEPASRVRRIYAPYGTQGVRVEKLKVKEGEDVEEGALLAELDNVHQVNAVLEESKSRLAVAEVKLDQVIAGAKKSDIDAQEIAVKNLKGQMETNARILERSRNLFQRKVITEEEQEKRTWEYNHSELNYKQALSLLESIKQVRDTDVAVAREEVYAAKATVEKCKADLLQAHVKAPIRGRILKIHTREGEKLGDTGLLEMADVKEMQAVAEVYEADLGKIKLGITASVIVPSLNTTLKGTVCELGYIVARKDVLSNDPVSDTDARVVEVRVSLDEKDVSLVERFSQARVEVRFNLE